MISIRDRYISSDARLLPWGDPYILQLFEAVMNVKPDSQKQDFSAQSGQAEYRRIRIEAQPPLGDRSPDFDMPRHGGEIYPGDDAAERE